MGKEFKVGERYGMLTVLKETPKKIYKNATSRRCLVRCDCGNEKEIFVYQIVSGGTKSCGCLGRELLVSRNTTHGMRNTKVYKKWSMMKYRCNNENARGYHNYGGRGITYESKRETFQGFRDDMKEGYQDGLEIDRIDNNGNYCKENCRWVTTSIQSRNRRGVKKYFGKTLPEICEAIGYPLRKADRDRREGKSIENVLQCYKDRYVV